MLFICMIFTLISCQYFEFEENVVIGSANFLKDFSFPELSQETHQLFFLYELYLYENAFETGFLKSSVNGSYGVGLGGKSHFHFFLFNVKFFLFF